MEIKDNITNFKKLFYIKKICNLQCNVIKKYHTMYFCEMKNEFKFVSHSKILLKFI